MAQQGRRSGTDKRIERKQPKPDNRYLQHKGGRFYAQIAVPRELQERLGQKVMVAYLGTADRREAQSRRWEYVNPWREAFDRARKDGNLSADDIEAIAQTERERVIALMASEPVEPDDHESDFPAAGTASEALSDTLADLREGDYRSIWPALMEASAAAGMPFPALLPADGEDVAPPSQPELTAEQGALAKAMMRAHVAALEEYLAERRDEAAPPVRRLHWTSTSAPEAPTRRRGKAMRISQAAKEYIADIMADPEERWTNQTKAQNEFAFRLFASFVGDCPIDAVTAKDAFAFRDAYKKINPNFGRSKHAKKLSFTEIAAHYPAEPGKGPASRTIERNISHLYGLFQWSANGRHFEGANPFENVAKAQSAKGKGKGKGHYKPFTEDELRRLFHSKLFTKTRREHRITPKRHTMDTAMLWLPLIALFGGEREEEIAQLRASDVQRERIKTEDGKTVAVDFFNLTDGEGQSLKSNAARRKVPIHPMLIRCGFMEYVAHVKRKKHEWLFPGLEPSGPDKKRSAAFVKAFGRYRKNKCKIERLDKNTGRNVVTFHSLRKNFGSACENAFIPESNAARVLGHEIHSLSYGLYSKGLSLDRLKTVVDKVAFPELDLSHLYAEQVAEAAE